MKKTLIATLFAGAALCACNTPERTTGIETIDLTGEWTITQANGISADSAETMPFILFSDSGTVNGNASVNTFFGRYEANGDSLRLSDMGVTMMSGRSMELEMAILQAMDQCQTVELENEVAHIKDAQGNTIMTMKRNSSSIVEE